MTDLEELFLPLIDESARYREPVDAIEARVRDLRVRRRRRRAQFRFGAAVLAVALTVTAVGVVHAHDNRSPAPPVGVATTTLPSVVAPAGWSTYDYGLARLSIPPGWSAGTGCPGPRELVLTDPTNEALGCGAGGSPSIVVEPIDGGFVFHPNNPALTVNGIPYEVGAPSCFGGAADPCPTLVWAPRVGVELAFDGIDDYHSVLQTLTYSTYARVLQQPFGAVPASWKTISFQGYSARVPADWPTVDLRSAGFCYPAPNTIYLGTSTMVANCPFEPAVQPPRASLQLESTGASSPPTDASGWHHNGLRFTRSSGYTFTPFSTELVLNVDGPHGRLLVTLGLGLDPAIARGILGSLRPLD